jgi:hypothetical protein
MSQTCPIHRNRELGETGHCVDCGFNWHKNILEPFEQAYTKALTERDLAFETANQQFSAKIRQMQKDAVNLNKRADDFKRRP